MRRDAQCQLKVQRNVRTDICLRHFFPKCDTQRSPLWDLAGECAVVQEQLATNMDSRLENTSKRKPVLSWLLFSP